MPQKAILGKLGEDLACQYLLKKQYKIIERNYRRPWGEIDIVTMAPDTTLVFIEVKTMRLLQREDELKPEDQMTFSKLKKLHSICEYYTRNHHEIMSEKAWRMDLIAISVFETGEKKIEHKEHIY